MKTLANLIVLGNEELGRTLGNHLPGAGVIEQVRTVPQGTALNKALVEGLKGLDVQTVGVVVVMGDDDSLTGFVARLEKAAFRTLVVGEGGVVADPFTPDDVIAALNDLPETDFILPIGGEDGEVRMTGSGLAPPVDGDAEMDAGDGPADEPGDGDAAEGAEVPAWAEGSDGDSAPPWMISDEEDAAEEEAADQEGPAEESADEETEQELVDQEPDWGDPDDAPAMPAWATEPDPEPAAHQAPAAPAWATEPDPSPDVPAWATEPDPDPEAPTPAAPTPVPPAWASAPDPEPAAPAWATDPDPEPTAHPDPDPDPDPAAPAWATEPDPEPEAPNPPARPEAAAHPAPAAPAWAAEHAPTQESARPTPPAWASESPPIVPEVEAPAVNGWTTPHPNTPAPAPSNGHEVPWAATGHPAHLSESLDHGGPVEVFNAAGGNRRSGTGPQVLVFASYKGGAGKTSTALLAASALAEAAGKPGQVVLVDANTAQASISTLLDLRNEAVPDIMRLLDPPWDPKKVTRSLTAIPDTNLHVLFAPHNKRDKRIRNITPQLFRRIVNELRNTYRYIVIDTPVAQNVGEPIFDEFVFTDADELVIVTNPEKESQENNLEFAEIACDPVAGGGRAFPMQHLWILLNRARDGVGYDEVNVRDEFRQYNFAGAVPESDAILRAANDARLHLASSPARDALLHALANITGDESLRPSSAPPTVDGAPRNGGWRGLLAKVGLGG